MIQRDRPAWSWRWVKAVVHATATAICHVPGVIRPSPSSPRRILISGYTGLGHHILRSAFLRQLAVLFPDAKVSIIAGDAAPTEQLLGAYQTLVLRPAAAPIEKLIFFWRLRRQAFDVVFLPFDAAPTFLIRGSVLAGIPIRIGHVLPDYPVPRYYYTTAVPVPVNGVRSEIDLNLDLLEALWGRPFRREYRLELAAVTDTSVLHRYGLQPRAYMCVQMSAANGLPTTKRWPEAHFQRLLGQLLDRYPLLAIVALGDAGDAPLVNRVCTAVLSPRLRNLTGRVTLAEAKTLIARCRFIVCHDSGLLHLGNALETDVVALYGPSDPDQYATRLTTFHLLRERCDCPQQGLFPGLYTCAEDEAAARCPMSECMRRLSVDRVLNTCAALLDRGAAYAPARDVKGAFAPG